MDTHKVADFLHYHPRRWIGYGKYSLIQFDFSLPDIVLEAISQLLRYVDHLPFSSRFCVSEKVKRCPSVNLENPST